VSPYNSRSSGVAARFLTDTFCLSGVAADQSGEAQVLSSGLGHERRFRNVIGESALPSIAVNLVQSSELALVPRRGFELNRVRVHVMTACDSLSDTRRLATLRPCLGNISPPALEYKNGNGNNSDRWPDARVHAQQG
jgi:hypothetical protein